MNPSCLTCVLFMDLTRYCLEYDTHIPKPKTSICKHFQEDAWRVIKMSKVVHVSTTTRKVAELRVMGKSIPEIAKALGISERSVYNHLELLKKQSSGTDTDWFAGVDKLSSPAPENHAPAAPEDCNNCNHGAVCRFKEAFAANKEWASCRHWAAAQAKAS